MDSTKYYKGRSQKPDRAWIQNHWIEQTILEPEFEQVQPDGRIRKWRKISEANNRYLRVVILDDGKTVHNAFFDRSFKPAQK